MANESNTRLSVPAGANPPCMVTTGAEDGPLVGLRTRNSLAPGLHDPSTMTGEEAAMDTNESPHCTFCDPRSPAHGCACRPAREVTVQLRAS